MQHRLFSRALVACISEGRSPHPHELAAMTEKLWNEAIAPSQLGSRRDLATALARLALSGDQIAASPHHRMKQ